MKVPLAKRKKMIVAALLLGGVALAKTRQGGRQAFIALARAQKGKPYVWGAEGPSSFDCSGLVQWCYGQLGITTPRVVTDQANGAPRRIDVAAVGGWQIAKTMLIPGDCVGIDYDPDAQYDHVAIWTGTSFIHATGGPACPNHPTARCKVVEDAPDHFGASSMRTIYSYIG